MPDPLPKRLLYAERLRRRMRVRFGGTFIADSENVVLLFEPGLYPVAYFPEADLPEPLDKPADGNLLVCCSRPIRDVVIDL